MAAANGNNPDQYRKEMDDEELRSSIGRLFIPHNYPNVELFREFASPTGRGIQAAINIPRGTPIIAEVESFFVKKGRYISAEQARRPIFQSLSDPFPTGTITDRFNANNFQMGGGKRGIFAQSSRFNRSCIPNAHFAWNRKAERLTVHAIADIPQGAEIFINYRNDDSTKLGNERRQKLLAVYNFTCTCGACQPNTFGIASDNRRGQMRDLRIYLQGNRDPTLAAGKNKLLAKIKAFSLLLQQEGLLYPQLADMYHEEYKWYGREMGHAIAGAESDQYKARILGEALQVARKKLDLDVACTGYDSPEVDKTLQLIDHLRQL